MSKVYFKGVKFKSGTTEGWRPSFITDASVDQQELAERVVLECGLAMSPSELLLGFRSVLERAPQYVAADGRTREIAGLMKWYASASGRLDSEGGDWNDLCKGNVKVSLLKNAKATLAGPFENVNTTASAKVDNVTWVGAQGVLNVVKAFQNFAAYGRNLTWDATNCSAKLYKGTTGHTLTCITSGVSSVMFGWPAGLTVESGEELTFEMYHNGGISGAPLRKFTKKVIALDVTPIATTSDGVGKVFTMADNLTGSDTELTLGHEFGGGTENLFPTDSGTAGCWYRDTENPVKIKYDGGASEITLIGTAAVFAANGKSVTIDTEGSFGEKIPGTYSDAKIVIPMLKNGGQGENVEIPINLKIQA